MAEKTKTSAALIGTKILDVPASSKAKLVYLCMLHHRNTKTGECFPSVPTMHDETGLSESSVSRAKKELIALGYISEIHITNENGACRSNHYLLLLDFPEDKEKESISGTANADIDPNKLNNNINVTTNITDNVSESQPNATDLQLNSVADTTELTMDALKEIMNYAWLRDTATKDSELSMLDSVFELIYEVYTQTQSEYKINDYPIKGEVVKSKLIKLTHYNIKTAISTFLTNAETTEIRNPKSYLLTILYNTSLTSKITGAVALNDAGL